MHNAYTKRFVEVTEFFNFAELYMWFCWFLFMFFYWMRKTL